MRLRLLLCFCLPAALLAAGHNRLLPSPREVRYSGGSLPLNAVSVRVSSVPSAEDRFTGMDLALSLTRLLGRSVAVDSAGAAPAINLVRTGAASALPGKDDPAPGPDCREAYTIEITPQGAEVRAPGSAGLYYGIRTLLQMVEGEGAAAVLPAAQVRDWPSLAYRGVMMDLSHGPLPTVAEIQRQIDFLARFKANQYYFYSELSIELKGYPLINPGARYSQEDVRRIIDYARERHIDVVPCLEFYGHLHDLFRLERYAGLSPLPHGGEINPRHPRIAPMLKDWVDQMAALFPSPWFHVGLDEPWELERAGSAAAGVEPGKLYQDHLNEMARMVAVHGKKMMFWADVASGAALFRKYPELASNLPPGVIAVPWHYRPEKSYDAIMSPFVKARVPQVVGTGIWGWQDVSPDFETTFDNIDGFLAGGRRNGAIGVIHTNWSDDAQILFRATLPAMAYGAAAAWQDEPPGRAAFWSDYAARVYPAGSAPHVAAGLQSLARAQATLIRALGAETRFRLWDDPLLPARLKTLRGRRELLSQARLQAEEAQENLLRAEAAHPDPFGVPALLISARLIDYAGMKFLYALELEDIFIRLGSAPSRSDLAFWLGHAASRNHSRLGDLQDAISGLKDDYRALWLAEYTPYRLSAALGRFDAEFEYWRRLQAAVWDFNRGFTDSDQLPPLESFRPWGVKPR